MSLVLESTLQINGVKETCQIYHTDGKVERIEWETEWEGEPTQVLTGDDIPFETMKEAEALLASDDEFDRQTEDENFRDDKRYHESKDGRSI